MRFMMFILAIMLIYGQSQSCKTPTAGFVFKQLLTQSGLSSTGTEISGDGKFLLLTFTPDFFARKSTLYTINGGTITSMTPTPIQFNFGGQDYQSFSNDGSILVITGRKDISIYRPTLIGSLTSTNFIQKISTTGQNIYAEVSQDGNLLIQSMVEADLRTFHIFVYRWNSVTNMFDNPIPLTDVGQNQILNISPNSQSIVSYPATDRTSMEFKIYQKDTTNSEVNAFLSPIKLISPSFRPRYGDMTNNVFVYAASNSSKIYKYSDGTLIQDLFSLILQPSQFSANVNSIKISNDQRFIIVGQVPGKIYVLQKNPTTNLYQRFQVLSQGSAFVIDVGITENNQYLVGAFSDSGAAIYINCFKDYATNCQTPLQASVCLPTFTPLGGDCVCQSPLILKKDETNCLSTGITLGAIAGCCATEQSWSRALGGSCISCPSSLNCQKCNLANSCQICKTTFIIQNVGGVNKCVCGGTDILDNDHCCQSPCKTCLSETPNICLSCLQGILDGDHCCKNLCKTCLSDNPNACLSCLQGILDGNHCCQSPCKTCLSENANTCLSCLQGLFLDKIQCTNCLEKGKYISGKLCLKCSEQCETCKDNANFCLKCAKGYFRKNDRCTKCNYRSETGKFEIRLTLQNNC